MMDQRDRSALGVRPVTPHRDNGTVTHCLRSVRYSDTDQRPCARHPAFYRIFDKSRCRSYRIHPARAAVGCGQAAAAVC